MSDSEAIMCYVSHLSVLETPLEIIRHSVKKTEKRITVLNGLRNQFDVSADIIRGMNKKGTEAVVVRPTKEVSLKMSLASGVKPA